MIKSIKSIYVNQPNGSTVTASFSGSTRFSLFFFLTDVLCIPNFTFNLISITKLISALNYQLIFQNDKCLIQEENSLKKIGLARVQSGLYYLVDPAIPWPRFTCNNVHVNTSSSVFDTRHSRLGHVLFDIQALLHKHHPSIPCNKVVACDACHFANQK